MTLLDLETLLKPVSDAAPCGEAADYDIDFLELEVAAKGKPGHRMGDSFTAGEAPDWNDVVQRACTLAQRTKDLRIAVIATRAAMNIAGYDGLREGLELIAGYVEQYWDSVHPMPDVDDGDDQTVRLNAVANLCSPNDFMVDVRTVPLTQSKRFGNLSYRHYLDAQKPDHPQPTGTSVTIENIEAAYSETDPELIKQMASCLEMCSALITRIDRGIREHVNSPVAIGLDALTDLLMRITNWNDGHRKHAAESITEGSSRDFAPASNEIRGRGDVVGMLDRICNWYRVNEPASPVPALLERAIRLVSKDFMALVLELAPDGANQFRSLAGLMPDGTPRGI